MSSGYLSAAAATEAPTREPGDFPLPSGKAYSIDIANTASDEVPWWHRGSMGIIIFGTAVKKPESRSITHSYSTVRQNEAMPLRRRPEAP
jgi:hypothetical protein